MTTSRSDSGPGAKQPELASAHTFTVLLFNTLRDAGYELSPPDSDSEPTDFGVCDGAGSLLYIVEVQPW